MARCGNGTGSFEVNGRDGYSDAHQYDNNHFISTQSQKQTKPRQRGGQTYRLQQNTADEQHSTDITLKS